MYALSAAARGNTDVQAAILSYIKPETIQNIDHNESKTSTNIKYKNSYFAIAMANMISNNHTDMDLARKIWSFTADMLEERRYIRDDLTNSVGMNANVLEQLNSFQLLGDYFCTVPYVHSTVQSLNKYINTPANIVFFEAAMHELPSNTNSMTNMKLDKINRKETKASLKYLPSYRSVLNDILISLREQLQQCPNSLMPSISSQSQIQWNKNNKVLHHDNEGNIIDIDEIKKSDRVMGIFLESLLHTITEYNRDKPKVVAENVVIDPDDFEELIQKTVSEEIIENAVIVYSLLKKITTGEN
jgi:hypothetical protein